jgi:hypothetical protein
MMSVLESLIGSSESGEESIVDPVIKAGLNLLISRFGYTNVMRVMKSMKQTKKRGVN